MRSVIVAGGIFFLGAGLVGVALSTGGASAEDQSVDTGNLYFCDPSFAGQVCDTAVNVGDTVTWNVSAGFHTVTECDESFNICPPSGGFDSGQLEQGDTFSQTFPQAGTYEYYCAFHPTDMRGRVIVSAQPTAPPTPTPAPTSPGATAAPAAATGTRTAAPVAVPQTGGAPGENDGSALWLMVAGTLLAAASAAFIYAARRN